MALGGQRWRRDCAQKANLRPSMVSRLKPQSLILVSFRWRLLHVDHVLGGNVGYLVDFGKIVRVLVKPWGFAEGCVHDSCAILCRFW